MRVDDALLMQLRSAAQRAGHTIREHFSRGGAATESKDEGPASLVTAADLASDEILRDDLARLLPEAAILSEEHEDTNDPGGLRFIVDPLDGTLNFSVGYPEIAVSLALWDGTAPLAAVVYHPLRDETWTAWAGGGAFHDGERISGRARAALSETLVFSGWPYDKRWIAAVARSFERLAETVREVRVVGSAALGLCYAASGIGDAFVEVQLAPWDIAAGVLIAREAGLAVTDAAGAPVELERGDVVAVHPRLQESMIALTLPLAEPPESIRAPRS